MLKLIYDMKRIVLAFLLLLSCALLRGQETQGQMASEKKRNKVWNWDNMKTSQYNDVEPVTSSSGFKIASNELIWQHVFDFSGSFDDLKSLISSCSLLDVVSVRDSSVSLRVMPFKVKSGRRYMQESMLVSCSEISGNAVVQYKQGRYRTTVSGIIFDVSGHAMFPGGVRQSAEFFALKGNGSKLRLSDSFVKDVAPYVNDELVEMFTFTNDKLLDDDF